MAKGGDVYTLVVGEGGWPRRRQPPPPIFASTHTTKCPTPPSVLAAIDKVDMAPSPPYLARRRCSFVENVSGRRVCFPWRCFIFVERQKEKGNKGRTFKAEENKLTRFLQQLATIEVKKGPLNSITYWGIKWRNFIPSLISMVIFVGLFPQDIYSAAAAASPAPPGRSSPPHTPPSARLLPHHRLATLALAGCAREPRSD